MLYHIRTSSNFTVTINNNQCQIVITIFDKNNYLRKNMIQLSFVTYKTHIVPHVTVATLVKVLVSRTPYYGCVYLMVVNTQVVPT